uniref:Uncharacterized protein n=1 Tax=Pseudictyota dubia TaxID=2749911 RepID=A0A7R9VKW7_9STRA
MKLWQSFFRSKAEFVTTCNVCLDKLEHLRQEKPIRSPGADRPTRPGDVSSDDEDEDDAARYDPMIVVRSSDEGKMMSKWLEAARARLGGDFPRKEANETVSRYIAALRKRKLRNAQKNAVDHIEVMNNVEEDSSGFGPVDLSDSSKRMMKLWVQKSRDSRANAMRQRFNTMQQRLADTLSRIKEEDDWFYSKELRVKGTTLETESKRLSLDREVKEAETAAAVRKAQKKLDEYCHEMDIKLDARRSALEDELSSKFPSLQNEARAMELRRKLEEMKSAHDSEEEEAQATIGTIPDDMLARHNEAIKEIEQQIADEAKQAETTWSTFEAERRRAFAREERAIQRDVKDRQNDIQREIESIKQSSRTEIEQHEKLWTEEVSSWLAVAARKVSVKEQEDQRVDAAEKESRNRKRRMQRRAS